MYSDYDFHGFLLLAKSSAVAVTGTSGDLTAYKLGLFDKKTNAVVTAANAGSFPVAYFAQGSGHANDKIGPFHGGYKESIKSPGYMVGIDAKRVTKFYKNASRAATKQKVSLFWDGDDASTSSAKYECGKTYYMYLEVQGEGVLRTLNRYFYKHLGAFTGCCADDCSSGCTAAPADAALVMLDYANQINNHPVYSKFVLATPIYQGVAGARTVIDNTYVTPTVDADKAAVVAGLEVEIIYSETVFAGDANFEPGEYVSNHPLNIIASTVDQDGNPCTDEIRMNSTSNENVTELVAGKPAKGLGEILIRDFIFSQTMRGEFFYHDQRRKTVNEDPTMGAVDRTASFTRYFIKYSLPQKSNSNNTFSEDQYLLCIAIDTTNTALITSFETLMAAWFTANNAAIALETIV